MKEKKQEWVDGCLCQNPLYENFSVFYYTWHTYIITTTFTAFGFPFGAALLIPLRFLVQFWRSGTVKRRRRAWAEPAAVVNVQCVDWNETKVGKDVEKERVHVIISVLSLLPIFSSLPYTPTLSFRLLIHNKNT